MKLVALKFNEAQMHRLLQSPTGPVARDIRRRANNVLDEAQHNASGGVVRRRSGELEKSYRVEMLSDPRLKAQIGSDSPVSTYLEEGTDPHAIVKHGSGWLRSAPDNPDPLRHPRLRAVSHPGNPPKPILRNALDAFDP